MFIKHHPFLIHCIYTSPPQRDGIPCYSRTGTGGVQRHRLRRHPAGVGHDLHAPACRLPQGFAKGWVSGVVGGKVQHVRHLDHEEGRGPVALLHGPHQLMQMPDTTLRGGVREQAVALPLQRHALHLHQVQPLRPFQTEVQPGVPVTVLRVDGDLRLLLANPLGKNAVGGLSVHVDEPVALLHGDEVPRRPAGRIGPTLQIDRGPPHQQLPAAACVLHMAHHRLALQLYMGDEPVGPLQKVRLPHLSVLQVHRLLCPIIAHKDTFEKDIISIHPRIRYKCLRFFLTPDQNCVILARN